MADSQSPGWKDILQAVSLRDGAGTIEIPTAWTQGRATFGGLVAGIGIRAMRQQLEAYEHEAHRPLRSMLVSFVGPVPPGTVGLKARVLRQGRAVTQVEARLLHGEETVCVVLGSYGAERASTIRIAAPPAPNLPAPESLTELPYLRGVTPSFTQFLEFRWASGAMPFTGADEAKLAGWCRLADASVPVDEELVATLVDAWPAPVIAMLTSPKPASSVTWSLNFVHPLPKTEGHPWWMYASHANVAADGYAHCTSALWDRSGQLVAQGVQMVAVFG